MEGEWSVKTLDDLATVIDSRHKTPVYSVSGLPMVRVVDVKGGRLDLTETKQVSCDVYQDFSKGRDPKIGDLIITRVGSFGNLAYVDSDSKFCLGQNTALIIPKVDWRFLYYQLISPRLQQQMRFLAVGAVQKTISLASIKQLEVLLPSSVTQKSIAHILGTLDDKIELNRRMNETLESMARALFKSWFVDFDPVIDNALAAGNPIPEPLQARAETRRALGSQRKPLPENTQKLFPDAFVFDEEMGWIPEGWSITTFGEVSECFDRKRVPLSKKQREDKKPGVIPYHGATSVMDYINEWIFDDVFLLIGEDGSVIQEDGTPFIQYIWGKTWVNNHAHVLQGKDGVSTEHLLQFMACQNMTAYVTGAVQPKINQRNMNSIPFILASDKVNHNFGGMLSPIYSRYKQLIEQQNTLTKLRDTLLPKLLSGELRVPEAMAAAEEALS